MQHPKERQSRVSTAPVYLHADGEKCTGKTRPLGSDENCASCKTPDTDVLSQVGTGNVGVRLRAQCAFVFGPERARLTHALLPVGMEMDGRCRLPGLPRLGVQHVVVGHSIPNAYKYPTEELLKRLNITPSSSCRRRWINVGNSDVGLASCTMHICRRTLAGESYPCTSPRRHEGGWAPLIAGTALPWGAAFSAPLHVIHSGLVTTAALLTAFSAVYFRVMKRSKCFMFPTCDIGNPCCFCDTDSAL